MERDHAPSLAEHAGSHLRHALEALPQVSEVRGLGLLLAAELAPGIDARTVAADALAAGLVVNAVTPSALRLAPPLVVTTDELDEGVGVLSGLLAAEAARSTPGAPS